MAYKVHIKIADRGWILERCASEIAKAAGNVTFDTAADRNADIQYYINYSAFNERLSPIEVGFFTHAETSTVPRERFFSVARAVDHRVCMSSRYAEELSSLGRDQISTISPGVDLDELRPSVRIGVIGRTYHTGRKGEALVAQVMDVPFIEWRFTGTGWPGPSRQVPDGQMGEFYNDLDYVLVPSLYEGGPMSVLEGLSCGIPIISSDVGWASEFPHIHFENGNPESLRRVLCNLVDERLQLRAHVQSRTWTAWGERHVELFDRLAHEFRDRLGGMPQARAHAREIRAFLVTHGGEGNTLGGPSVRVPRTASELRLQGVQAHTSGESEGLRADLAHIFNVWPVETAFAGLDRASLTGIPAVFSPIFLNLAHSETFNKRVPSVYENVGSASQVRTALRAIQLEIESEDNLPIREPYPGYHGRVLACLSLAGRVLCLSEYERRCLEFLGMEATNLSIIRNPVDAEAFGSGNPDLFRERFGIEDYILCVGRIEPRKNQLLLAQAAKVLNKAVVFVGHEGNEKYAKLLKATAGGMARFVPRIEPNSRLLASAYAGAAVFCLPSWSEGAPLAALEAGAAGLPLVLSDRSGEVEYFGTYAQYVNPCDVDSLCFAIEMAIRQRSDEVRKVALQAHIRERFSWQSYAKATAETYRDLVESVGSAIEPAITRVKSRIYVDLTTSVHNTGHPTGIARVEQRAFGALVEGFGNRVVPVAWNSRTGSFLELKLGVAAAMPDLDELDIMERFGRAALLTEAPEISDGAHWLVLGGAWIRNAKYLADLARATRRRGANLTVLIHDLIQMKMAHAYPDGVGEQFEQNAQRLLEISESFLVYSDVTRSDLEQFLSGRNLFAKQVAKFPMGDMVDHEVVQTGSYEPESLAELAGAQFVLYVSSIDTRKNHVLLVNVWRRLIEERGSRAPHLVLVGRTLWGGEEIVRTIQREPALSKFVHILQDVNDFDLEWLYSNALISVYPSLYEGWGLPVAESLAHGKICLTSDRTSTREISPRLSDLLDPYDFRLWLDRISLYIDNPGFRAEREARIRKEYRTTNWRDSAAAIVSILDSVPQRRIQPKRVLPNSVVCFGRQVETASSNDLFGDGWSPPEQLGRWTIGSRSAVSFRVAGHDQDVWVRLKARALVADSDSRRRFTFSVAGSEHISREIGRDFDNIDLQFTGSTATHLDVEIEITAEQTFSPKSLGIGADERELGLCVQSIAIAQQRDMLSTVEQVYANTARQADAHTHNPARRVIDVDRRNALETISRLTMPIERLPDSNLVYRLARISRIDRLILRVHGKLFNRTNEAIRRLVEVIGRE